MIVRMNFFEKLIMNSPIRKIFLRKVEAPILKDLFGSLEGMRVLEIGCARGHSTKLVLDFLKASSVVAIDLDPDSIEKAKKNLSKYSSDRVQFHVGDIANLQFPDESFDAVIDFAALHHVPDWQSGILEIKRILKPGGLFLFEEVTRQWLNWWFARMFFVHPLENRFSYLDLIAELNLRGLEVKSNFVVRGKGDFIFGAAVKK